MINWLEWFRGFDQFNSVVMRLIFGASENRQNKEQLLRGGNIKFQRRKSAEEDENKKSCKGTAFYLFSLVTFAWKFLWFLFTKTNKQTNKQTNEKKKIYIIYDLWSKKEKNFFFFFFFLSFMKVFFFCCISFVRCIVIQAKTTKKQ